MYIVYNWSIHKKWMYNIIICIKGLLTKKNILHISHLVHYIVHHCKMEWLLLIWKFIDMMANFLFFLFQLCSNLRQKKTGADQVRFFSSFDCVRFACVMSRVFSSYYIKIIFKERITYFFIIHPASRTHVTHAYFAI